MGAIASQITILTIVYSTVYSDADQRKHQSSASLAFVREIHRGPVNSPHKWPVTRKMFPFDDVFMIWHVGTCQLWANRLMSWRFEPGTPESQRHHSPPTMVASVLTTRLWHIRQKHIHTSWMVSHTDHKRRIESGQERFSTGLLTHATDV